MMIELNDVQLGMIYHTEKKDNVLGVYNSHVLIQWNEEIDLTKLKSTWQYLLNKYIILKAYVKNNTYLDFDHSLNEIQIVTVDLYDASEDKINQIVKEIFSESIDINSAPMYKIHILRVSDNLNYFVWTHHHVLLSATSFSNIIMDMLIHYDKKPSASIDTDKEILCGEYNSSFSNEEEKYWKDLLEGFKESNKINTPIIIAGSNRPQHNNHMTKTKFKWDEFRLLADTFSVTINTIFLAAWSILLNRYTGNNDIVFGTVRQCYSGGDNVIGMDINTLPIRVKLSNNTTLQSLLCKIREQQINLKKYCSTSLRKISKYCFDKTDSRDDLFYSFFDYQPVSLQDRLESAGINMSNRYVSFNGRTHYPINAAAYFEKGFLHLKFDYNVNIFDHDLILDIEKRFNNILACLLNQNTNHVSDIEIYSLEEKQYFLNESRKNNELSMLDIFKENVRKNPDQIAVSDTIKHYSYNELDKISDRIAYKLANLVEPNCVIGFQLPQCVEQVVLMLSILKSGCIYLSINPTYPDSIKTHMINSSSLKLLVTKEKSNLEELKSAIQSINIDELIENSKEMNKKPLLTSCINSNKAAYVIFTSGSTGLPKPVLVEQKSLVNLIFNTNYINITENDVVAQMANTSFDAAVFEIWGALLNGATCQMIPKNILLDFDLLDDYIHTRNISIMLCITSLFNQIAQSKPDLFSRLKHLVVGGELLYTKFVEHVFTACKNNVPIITNAYGPTENTVISTCYQINSLKEVVGDTISIGYPIKNRRAYILDNNMNLAPPGIVGELYVGGSGLAVGYLNNKKLSDEKFIIYEKTNEKLYKTGDFAYRDTDNKIFFVERKDDQVKINGYRMSLDEIKSHLLSHPGIKDVALIIDEYDNRKNIVAFIVYKSKSILPDALREYLKNKLPGYMIPSSFIGLGKLPITKNHKLDSKKLKSTIADNKIKNDSGDEVINQGLMISWQNTFNQEITSASNFFNLGGDSIDALQLVSYAKDNGINITVNDIFQFPDIAQLNKKYCSGGNIKHVTENTENQEVFGCFYPTPIQSWFLSNGVQHASSFSQICQLSVNNKINFNQIRMAIKILVDYHDILRLKLVFIGNDKYPMPYISRKSSAKFDVSFHKAKRNIFDPLKSLEDIDLSQGDNMYIRFINDSSEENNKLIIALNHMVTDGVSWRILINDLNKLLDNNNDINCLVRKTVSYLDWSKLLFEYAQSAELLKEVPYFDNYISTSSNSNKDKTFKSIAVYKKQLNAQLIFDLKKVCEKQPFDFSDVLLLSYLKALESINESKTVSLESHGRDVLSDIDVTNTVGWFTNVYPFTFNGSSDNNKIKITDIYQLSKDLTKLKEKSYCYGILKYLSQNKKTTEKMEGINLPNIFFNYLGEFKTKTQDDICHFESLDVVVSDDFPQYFKLSMDIIFSEDNFIVTMSYDEEHFTQSKIIDLLNSFNSFLIETSRFFENNYYQLSPVQEGIYTYSKIHPETEAYLVQAVIDINGNVDINRLKKSCNKLYHSVDILRAGFESENGVLMQKVHRAIEIPLNFRKGLKSNIQYKLTDFVKADRQMIFDLSASPLIRFSLIQLSNKHYKFIVSFHHIILDGWSLYLTLDLLFKFYDKRIQNLSKNTFYTHYIKSLNRLSTKSNDADFWKNYLKKDYLPTQLNFQKAFSVAPQHKELPTLKHNITISDDSFNKIKQICQLNNLTTNVFFQFIWAISLSEYANSRYVCYGLISSGRRSITNSQNIIGPLISTLPISVEIDPCNTTDLFMKSLQENILKLQDYEHANILDISKHMGINPNSLFEYLFVYENYPTKNLSTIDFEVSNIDIIERTQYKITLYAIETDSIDIKFQYDPLYFEQDDMDLFFQSFENMIDTTIKHFQSKISDYYAKPTVEEKKRIEIYLLRKKFFNFSSQEDIFGLLRKNMGTMGGSPAIIYDNKVLNFTELSSRVNDISIYLQTHYSEQSIIGILLPRSDEYIIAILALLNVNIIFVPLDITLPEERLNFMVKKASIQAVVTKSDLNVKFLHTNFIYLDRLPENKGHFVCEASYSGDDVAYILFTSGSTGEPKGVAIQRASINAVISSVLNTLSISQPVRSIGLSSLIFDISLIDIFLPLLSKGALVLCSETERKDVNCIKTFIDNYKINFVQATPSFWEILLNAGLKLNTHTTLISTGEALPNSLAEKLVTNGGGVLWNFYGPTETTIWATGLEVKHHNNITNNSEIGLPLPGVDCYIMDDNLQIVKEGMIGELYIGGVGVGLNYVNAPDITNKNFIPNPFIRSEKLYKTGDLVRFTQHFGVQYKGRRDNQVKIYGKRIELSEIEKNINIYSNICTSTVILTNNDTHDKKLVAFVVLNKSSGRNIFNQDDLKKFLKTKLPDYMIPNNILLIDKIPLTSTQKTDIKALKNLVKNYIPQETTILEPRNTLESKLRAIWANVLSLTEKHIGVTDDFFLLGGNSLTSIKLSVAIEKEFSTYFSIRYVMEHSTIKEQAKKIQSQKKKYKTKSIYSEHTILDNLESPLITLSNEGHQHNIYFIHPIGGTVFRYLPLTRYLGQHFNIYGIQDPGLEAQAYLFNTFEALAKHYLKIIRAHQAKPPYIIGGASYGGNVSIEIAKSLQDQGIDDVYILSFDAWASYPAMVNNNREWFEMNINRQFNELKTMLPNNTKIPELLLDLRWQRQQLVAHYQAERRPYHLALFKADTLSPVLEPIQEKYNQWRDYCELPIYRYLVPGDHETLLNDPNANVLYQGITDCLKKWGLLVSASEEVICS